jgi:hypothetical protein
VDSIDDGRVIESFLEAHTGRFPGLEVQYDIQAVAPDQEGERGVSVQVRWDSGGTEGSGPSVATVLEDIAQEMGSSWKALAG